MLVLTRKVRESIVIGNNIEVTVLWISHDKVRLGIAAPREIPVFRKEIYLEITQGKPETGGSSRAEVDEALKRLTDKY